LKKFTGSVVIIRRDPHLNARLKVKRSKTKEEKTLI